MQQVSSNTKRPTSLANVKRIRGCAGMLCPKMDVCVTPLHPRFRDQIRRGQRIVVRARKNR